MNKSDVKKSIGKLCTVNGYGDLAMESEMKILIYNKTKVKIIRLTRSGLIQVQSPDNKLFSIPQKNLDIIQN